MYDHFEIQVLDHKKLRQLAEFPKKSSGYFDDSAANGEKIAHLEQANAFLQQILLLLKECSENQQEELSRTCKMLQNRAKESSNMKSMYKSIVYNSIISASIQN